MICLQVQVKNSSLENRYILDRQRMEILNLLIINFNFTQVFQSGFSLVVHVEA